MWLIMLAGCGSQGDLGPTVGILAPRSLQPVIDPAVGQWETDVDVQVYVGYDTPDRLQRQADGGTRADLFIAADRRWMDALQADGHTTVDDRYPLALDPLVFVTRSPNSPARDPGELVGAARGGARIGMISLELPEGVVTQQALKDTQVWSHVAQAVDHFATSSALRAALETGEVDLGVCRRSSVMAAYDLLSTHPFSQDHRYGSIVEIASLQRVDNDANPHSQALLMALTSGPGARERWKQAGLVVSIQRQDSHARPVGAGLGSAGSPGPPRPELPPATNMTSPGETAHPGQLPHRPDPSGQGPGGQGPGGQGPPPKNQAPGNPAR